MRGWRLAALLLLMAWLGLAAWADERILDYHSDIKVLSDASLEVHETIRVVSEDKEIEHGIYRDFPTRYKTSRGESSTVTFDVLDVLRDGHAEPYKLEDLQNGVRVRIGDKDHFLDPGEYTYELTYVVTRELGFFPDHDELYWNVTGNDWMFPIDLASAKVTLPGTVPPSKLNLTGYTGHAGSREQNVRFHRIGESAVTFETTEPLQTSEGLTIVVGFPKGMVTEPTRAQRIQWRLESNAYVAIGLAGLALVLLYYFAAWMLVGRDPRPGTIVVAYEPPDVSPAAVAFLQEMGYNQRVFVSAVVDLAVKQHLAIEQEGSLYRLKALKEGDGGLTLEEGNLLQTLFREKTEIKISAKEASTIQAATAVLTQALDLEESQMLFCKNGIWLWPGIVITLAAFVGIVWTVPRWSAGAAGFCVVWLSGWSFPTGAILHGSLQDWGSKRLSILASALFVFFFLFALLALALFVDLPCALVVFALLATNVVFVYLLRSLTPAGRKLLDQIEGFKRYLIEVDSDRMQRMNAPAKTPALFEKFLPYALALGVEQAWAKQFAGVLAQAAAAGSGTATAYSPAWLSGADWASFDAGRFVSSFSSGFSSAVSSAASPPGSSSGFSGGSSGGGGGGGGGGGW